MDGYLRWRNGLGLLLMLIYAVSASPTCTEDQKLRRNENDVICCYTARCNTSQRFEFCKQDQGRDICVNCPPGTYTNDKINTAQWDEESDFCVPIPLCNSDEVISVGNGCACNLAKGYWGVDSNNCKLDSNNCRSAGHQLRQKDGVCIRCDEDKFKPENGTYGVCQNKTKCKAGEEEVDGGSPERDRKCQANQIDMTSTLAPPTITTNTEPPNEENGNDDGVSILHWLLPLCLISIMLIIVTICLCRKYRIYTQILESFGNLCCQRRGTRNRSEDLPMNGKFQNGQKPSDCKSNGSDEQQLLDSSLTNGHAKGTDEADTSQTFLLDSSLTNGHATSTDEADKSQTFVTSVLDSKQPPLDSSLTNGHTTSTDDSENAETDAPQTFLKPIVDNDEEYPSLGESIFDNDKITSLEQNNGSLIGTQMSTASNDKTSPGSANNTGGNSVYDTARTGSTGNIPDSNLFHSLYTTVSNPIQIDHIGEGPKSKAVNSMTGNTEAPTNKMKTMPTESHVTGNTEPPTNNAKPIAAVKPLPRYKSTTSSRSQEATAPDNNDQRVPAFPTTDGGNDIQAASNEENSKFVPSHVNRPPDELSGNNDSIVTETGSQPIHVNMDDVNRHLPSEEETSESLDDDETASRNVIETGSESQLTGLGNILAAPESTSTTSSNEPSLPSVESENPGQYN